MGDFKQNTLKDELVGMYPKTSIRRLRHQEKIKARG